MTAPPNLHILFGAEDIARKVQDMAVAIHRALGPDLMVIALLKGSFIFTADLVRALHAAECAPRMDFMTLSSYGDTTQSKGDITIGRDITDDVRGARVLLVDDILESGRTLAHARKILLERGAASVHIAVLLEKPGKRAADVTAEFVGFTVPDKFVIGYGLDHANRYRELPFIGYTDG